MKKLVSLLLILFVGFGFSFPKLSSAATSPIYYAAPGTSKVNAGIYKSIPNQKASSVLKEKMYSLKTTAKPPIKLTDMNVYMIKDKVVKSGDTWSATTLPIQHVQAVGKELYFTKFLFSASYAGGGCGGGTADILELYKRSQTGKVTKVMTDKLSSFTKSPFVVNGGYIYYAKVQNQAIGNYAVIKYSLKTKKKTTIYKGADNFWFKGKYIYFVKKDKLYRMDLNGKGVKSIPLKVKLFTGGYCGDGNYYASNNGIIVTDWNAGANVNYYYDFSKNTITKLAPKFSGDVPAILDVDLNKKRFLGTAWDGSNDTLGLYDFKGKLLKKIMKIDYWKDGFKLYSMDVKKGELLYIQDSKLKQIKF